jgi:hypothetical protein
VYTVNNGSLNWKIARPGILPYLLQQIPSSFFGGAACARDFE